jgi:hypothetical protein
LRESARGDDGAVEAGGDLFQPGCEIHRRIDAGEIQPITAADVAVQHLADMERQTEAEAFDGMIAIGMSQGFEIGPAFPRCVENAAADPRGVAAVGDREYRQKSVAHEFQYLAALPQDRANLAIEIAIEHFHHGCGAAA